MSRDTQTLKLRALLTKPEFAAFVDEIRYTNEGQRFQWKSRCEWPSLCELLARAWEDGYDVGKLREAGPEEVETAKEDDAPKPRGKRKG